MECSTSFEDRTLVELVEAITHLLLTLIILSKRLWLSQASPANFEKCANRKYIFLSTPTSHLLKNSNLPIGTAIDNLIVSIAARSQRSGPNLKNQARNGVVFSQARKCTYSHHENVADVDID